MQYAVHFYVFLIIIFDSSDDERTAEAHRVRPLAREGRNVPGANRLRRLIDKHIYNRSGKRQSRIMRFLFHGDIGTESPLEAFDVLDRPAIASIARHARSIGGQSLEVDFDYWERKVDFYTHFNHTGDYGEFDPFNPHAPFLVNKTLEKYKQKLDQIESKSHIDARRHSRILTRDDGIYYPQEQHPHYAKLFTDLMLQAIYNTRLGIHQTKELRSRFRYDANYRIATLYTMCLNYVARIKALHATASNLLRTTHFKVKFLHYLVIYEKALAAHTDIESCAQRIDVERKWMRKWYKARMDKTGRVHGSNYSLKVAKTREKGGIGRIRSPSDFEQRDPPDNGVKL